jgi:sec-independent protein translocase protein TatB
VFGFSFGELCVLILVAMVVLGPKELPRYLRKAGQFASRLRRLAFEMREKSGIDEVLRTEGIDKDIAEIRKLARGELLGVASAVRSVTDAARANGNGAQWTMRHPPPALPEPAPVIAAPPAPTVIVREYEYPLQGADCYGASPDNAISYEPPPASPPVVEAVPDARSDATEPAAVAPPASPEAAPPATTPA